MEACMATCSKGLGAWEHTGRLCGMRFAPSSRDCRGPGWQTRRESGPSTNAPTAGSPNVAACAAAVTTHAATAARRTRRCC
eukprot:5495064-Prymnesium_polylepis.1